MALPTLTVSDFTGSLLVNSQTELFTQYIAEQYPEIVRDCLGGGAYADISTTIKQKWTDLFSGGAYTVFSNDTIAWNDGLTVAVKNFLYSSIKGDDFVPTNTGLVRALNENSTALAETQTARLAQKRYNSGVLAMQSVACFIANYANFAQPITGYVDNGGGSFTIDTTATKYLSNGDTVIIEGTEYVVSNVVSNASFDIASIQATTFDGDYISNPYAIVVVGNKRAMV